MDRKEDPHHDEQMADISLPMVAFALIFWTIGVFAAGMLYQDSRYDHVPNFPEVHQN